MKKFGRILLIDDDVASSYLSQVVIRDFQMAEEVTYCPNGDEAFKGLLEDLAKGRSLPNLILLDLSMPVMNGFEFMEALQQEEQLAHLLKRVIILTSSSLTWDLAQVRQYNISLYMTKPLTRAGSISMLLNLVDKWAMEDVRLRQGN